ncbi:MAG: hypothetical protein ON057_000240 [Glomeribacter sp. 1016415]|nr:hypothetical protein [Glomeribacter sp. 1016415]
MGEIELPFWHIMMPFKGGSVHPIESWLKLKKSEYNQQDGRFSATEQ